MRLPLILVAVFFLASCAYHVQQDRPGFLPGDDLPAAWGGVVNTAQCSNLVGTYEAFGEVTYVFVPPYSSKPNLVHISDVLWKPSWKAYQKRKTWQSFKVNQESPDLIAFLGALDSEFPIEFSVSCVDGWLNLRVPKHSAFSEGALRESEATYLIGKVSDGSLVVRVDVIHGTSSFWGAFRTKDSIIYWVKFIPADGTWLPGRGGKPHSDAIRRM